MRLISSRDRPEPGDGTAEAALLPVTRPGRSGRSGRSLRVTGTTIQELITPAIIIAGGNIRGSWCLSPYCGSAGCCRCRFRAERALRRLGLCAVACSLAPSVDRKSNFPVAQQQGGSEWRLRSQEYDEAEAPARRPADSRLTPFVAEGRSRDYPWCSRTPRLIFASNQRRHTCNVRRRQARAETLGYSTFRWETWIRRRQAGQSPPEARGPFDPRGRATRGSRDFDDLQQRLNDFVRRRLGGPDGELPPRRWLPYAGGVSRRAVPPHGTDRRRCARGGHRHHLWRLVAQLWPRPGLLFAAGREGAEGQHHQSSEDRDRRRHAGRATI